MLPFTPRVRPDHTFFPPVKGHLLQLRMKNQRQRDPRHVDSVSLSLVRPRKPGQGSVGVKVDREGIAPGGGEM